MDGISSCYFGTLGGSPRTTGNFGCRSRSRTKSRMLLKFSKRICIYGGALNQKVACLVRNAFWSNTIDGLHHTNIHQEGHLSVGQAPGIYSKSVMLPRMYIWMHGMLLKRSKESFQAKRKKSFMAGREKNVQNPKDPRL
eukprot:TRINITY_DN2670_c0_g1_i1.p1 TRINITY_DN2670_c0_g1~~TRINITY_DN2670_c0_g1_i1.p1  ORF type:complete len:139 (-),score=15.70 TRINITY_DN2670_c0_g1_i1:19-435(-)